MPRRFDLVVFDWDGTLMDSTTAIVKAMQNACRDLGLRVPSDASAASVIGLGLRDALAQAVPDIKTEQVPAMVERYRHYYLSVDSELILFDGIKPLLETLAANGHTLAIATGKSRVGLDRALLGTGISKFFAATRCADETFSKPHPAMLLELMERLNVEPARTLMIGDTTHDLRMAASAGTAAVAVTYGAQSIEELREVPAEAILDSVSSLRTWLAHHA